MRSLRFTNGIVWVAIVVVMFVNLLTFNELVPSVVANVTDLCALAVFMAFVVEALRGKSFRMPVKYVLVSVVLMSLVVISASVNAQSLGSIMLGIKTYFVYIPYFLLPFACNFSEEKIKHFLSAFLAIALMQVPLALFQRFIQHPDRMHAGDLIFGTLGISSFLSMFLVSTIAVLLGFFLRQKLKLSLLVGLAVFLFIPTTINETKGTVIMLPLALMAPAIVNAIYTGRIRTLIPIFGMVIFLIAGFLFVFSQFEKAVFGRELGDQDLVQYTFQDKDIEARSSEAPVIGQLKLNREKDVGRGDAMLLPYKILSNDPFSLAFGVGLGNTVETSIDVLAGDFKKYMHLKPDYTVASKVTWELGVLGFLVALAMMAMVTWDVVVVARVASFYGDFALGWVGVLAVIGFSMFYKDLIYGTVISAFFGFSQVICAAGEYIRIEGK